MEPFGALLTEVVDANPLEDMVGPWGLELQTSTVSTKSLIIPSSRIHLGLAFGLKKG